MTPFDPDQARCPACGEQSVLVNGTVLSVLRVNKDGNISAVAIPYGQPTWTTVFLGAYAVCNRSACGWEGEVKAGPPGARGEPTTVLGVAD